MRTDSQFTTMVHVLTLLACTDKPISSKWIAGSVNTNPVVIRQVIGHLRDAGIVETLPGSAGGARLKKDADQVTLGDVYQLVKKETFFGLHPSKPNPYCPVGRNIQEVLVELFDQMDWLIAEALAKISIADIRSRVSEREKERQEGSEQ